jgi:hypothetical protein
MSNFAERLRSGDGERKTLLTRQIAFEPLPASVLFAPFVLSVIVQAVSMCRQVIACKDGNSDWSHTG